MAVGVNVGVKGIGVDVTVDVLVIEETVSVGFSVLNIDGVVDNTACVGSLWQADIGRIKNIVSNNPHNREALHDRIIGKPICILASPA
jgi:hypothetical protein